MTTLSLTPNAEAVLERRYLLRNAEGEAVESPTDMFRRVARNIAAAESEWGGSPSAWEETFFEMLMRLDFLPNSPTLMNAGRELQRLRLVDRKRRLERNRDRRLPRGGVRHLRQ